MAYHDSTTEPGLTNQIKHLNAIFRKPIRKTIMRTFKPRFGYRLLAYSVVSLLLTLVPVALADYVPPPDASAPTGPGTTTGRRGGCTRTAETFLTAIAPQSHMGQTTSSHPSFTWFMPDAASYPMEFRLYQYNAETNAGSDRQLLYKTALQTSSGFMQFSLPADQPGLSAGQQYGWQIVVFCNPNRPSSALVAEAQIEVVDLPGDVASALATSRDRAERSTHYAEAGLWYDAIAEVLTVPENSATLAGIALIEDLAELEAASSSEASQLQSDRLQRIVELERP
jgi:hypothetical protein